MHRELRVLVRPGKGGRDMHRPSPGIDDRQHVRSDGISDHEKTARLDTVPGQDRGVHRRRLVADDLDEAKSIAES